MDLIHFLQDSTTAYFIVVTVLGLLVGSFLNVVILRLPKMMEREWRQQCVEFLQDEAADKTSSNTGDENDERFNLAYPRSSCPQCGHQITAIENIPVISYMLLKGKCSGCGTRISCRYPIIEFVTAVMSLLVAFHFGFTIQAMGALFLTWALIALTVIDFDHQLLPDSITLPYLWVGLLLSLYGIYTDSHSAIIGAMAGYLSLWTVYQGFRILTGKEGMGYGDFKLLAMLGAWMGWQAILPIILLSSLVGAVVGVSLILFRGRDRNIPIPFGPYLATAGWIALLWGNDITTAYWNYLGTPT
ncbi:MAG: prepilin peptidase [Gammaproteobacteria bacterium]